MTRPDEEKESKVWYVISRGALVALVLLVIFGAFIVMAFARVAVPSLRITVADTTVTESTTFTFTLATTKFLNVTQYVVRTQVNYSTVNSALPPRIQIRGNASTRTPGTTATQIDFLGPSGPISAKVSNGLFALNLPNAASYDVWIDYTSVAAGLGSGRCLAGALVLYYPLGDSILTNWSC